MPPQTDEILTENERFTLASNQRPACRKALRIIDAQAARIAELERRYNRAMRDVADLNRLRCRCYPEE